MRRRPCIAADGDGSSLRDATPLSILIAFLVVALLVWAVHG